MLLALATVVIMVAVVAAMINEDLITSFGMLVNVFIAGLVAFNFWEPLAAGLEEMVAKTPLQGYEDAICLLALFCPTLALLRLGLNRVCSASIEYELMTLRAGSAVFGLMTGYLVSGFLVCVMQTLPWHENFMYFQPGVTTGAGAAVRRYFPPDRVWLALMHRAGRFVLQDGDSQETFDQHGNFEARYARHRRFNDKRDALPHNGEFDREFVAKPE
jgi:hypothetical protein